jgi:PTH2 family peptidyl-tRNA hydrolase
MKQVIILRKDLNMRKGKMVAQGAHASIEADFHAMEINNEWHNAWYAPGEAARMKKIVVSVNSEQELIDFHRLASTHGLPTAIIIDAGLTEFKEPTLTSVAIGPAPDELVDAITKDLPLL